MDERELKLNSLSRYAKASPKFILEEHGHCEVPAGCGGVVLRWRNPRAGVPVTMWLETDGPGDMYLDGTAPSSSRPLVPFGTHVLAFAIAECDPAYTTLMFAGLHKPDEDIHVQTTAPQNVAETSVLSAADGSWKYSFDEPEDDAWMRPGFDDGGWQPMVDRPDRRPPEDPERAAEPYRVRRLKGFGAAGLGVSGRGGRVWIRKVFTIADPESA
ncbi:MULTISPECIES: hypothetical protein [Streptomyces]|uniref:Uncharacterized protein n=1 Tax=Streptomyces lonegramiae TaxID=3075524 RepID=A0ABU2XW19_9ACTN|nr:hypothetical protein [Streptomyces sp. DSM 41529]MDT0549692.1 hypothetical protein [Streptomyces sp. DSM 41529]